MHADLLQAEKDILARIEEEELPDTLALAGYAVIWDLCIRNAKEDGLRYFFTRHAFDESLTKTPTVRLDVEHDDGRIVLSKFSRKIVIRPDDLGLLVVAKLPDTELAREVLDDVRSKRKAEMSIHHFESQYKRVAPGIGRIDQSSLFAVTICSRGANPATAVLVTSDPGATSQQAALAIDEQLENEARRLHLKADHWDPRIYDEVVRNRRARVENRLAAL